MKKPALFLAFAVLLPFFLVACDNVVVPVMARLREETSEEDVVEVIREVVPPDVQEVIEKLCSFVARFSPLSRCFSSQFFPVVEEPLQSLPHQSMIPDRPHHRSSHFRQMRQSAFLPPFRSWSRRMGRRIIRSSSSSSPISSAHTAGNSTGPCFRN